LTAHIAVAHTGYGFRFTTYDDRYSHLRIYGQAMCFVVILNKSDTVIIQFYLFLFLVVYNILVIDIYSVKLLGLVISSYAYRLIRWSE